MGALLLEVIRALAGSGQAWGLQQLQTRRLQLLASLAAERRRLFDVLALLSLGLMLCAFGLCGLLALAWWALPAESRAPLLSLMMLGLFALGAMLLAAARWRMAQAQPAATGSGPAAGASRGPVP